jgi:hypothetical protein
VWESIEEVEDILSYDDLVLFWKEIKNIVNEVFKG